MYKEATPEIKASYLAMWFADKLCLPEGSMKRGWISGFSKNLKTRFENGENFPDLKNEFLIKFGVK